MSSDMKKQMITLRDIFRRERERERDSEERQKGEGERSISCKMKSHERKTHIGKVT